MAVPIGVPSKGQTLDVGTPVALTIVQNWYSGLKK